MKTHYIFTKAVQINKTLMEQCNILYQTCCTKDGIKHPYCFEDEFDVLKDFPRLYYVQFKNKLLGFLSVYIIDNNRVEFCIFVHPDYRGKHLGTRLLNTFFADYPMTNIEVSISPENQLGIHFLTKNAFDPASTELLMKTQLKSYIPQKMFQPHFQNAQSPNHFKYMIEHHCVGSCNISVLSDTCICISDVEIYEEYQNQGLGFQFMLEILQEMSLHYEEVLLHVTKENIPAYKLYRKLGFQEMDAVLIYTLQHHSS